jgi:2-keto-4-pentenoate hydratase/2-oxohepta-3-ene-1,7-dioic acid hydratase in catechol pathway
MSLVGLNEAEPDKLRDSVALHFEGKAQPLVRERRSAGCSDRAAAEVSGAAPDIALSQVTLLAPITYPDKIICADRNYRAHAAEAGGPPPENPQVFLRLVNTLVAHNQPMVCPRISGDFDCELAVIIGKPGRHIAKPDALSHVFGYTCGPRAACGHSYMRIERSPKLLRPIFAANDVAKDGLSRLVALDKP